MQRMRGDWIMRQGENKVTSEDLEDELPSGLVAQCTHACTCTP